MLIHVERMQSASTELDRTLVACGLDRIDHGEVAHRESITELAHPIRRSVGEAELRHRPRVALRLFGHARLGVKEGRAQAPEDADTSGILRQLNVAEHSLDISRRDLLITRGFFDEGVAAVKADEQVIGVRYNHHG